MHHKQDRQKKKPQHRTTFFVGAVLAIVGSNILVCGATRPEEPLRRPPFHVLRFDEKELVGKYYLGDGLGVNCSLMLQANHRFHFAWRGCLGEYDRNKGRWEVVGDVVVIKPERPNKREGFQGMNVRFIPVKWGTRIYLVDENQMPGFCVRARQTDTEVSDRSYIHGSDYVKLDGKKLSPLKGRPILPKRYREYYEMGAVTAKVVKIEADGRVILDKGSAERMRVGTLLDLAGWSDRIEVKVTSVGQSEATGEVSYFWNSARRVKVGDTFTTGDQKSKLAGTGFQRYPQPSPKR